jgi:hypothetical protein
MTYPPARRAILYTNPFALGAVEMFYRLSWRSRNNCKGRHGSVDDAVRRNDGMLAYFQPIRAGNKTAISDPRARTDSNRPANHTLSSHAFGEIFVPVPSSANIDMIANGDLVSDYDLQGTRYRAAFSDVSVVANLDRGRINVREILFEGLNQGSASNDGAASDGYAIHGLKYGEGAYKGAFPEVFQAPLEYQPFVNVMNMSLEPWVRKSVIHCRTPPNITRK